MIYEIKNGEIARPVFGDWQETIIWSCLQGIMGHIYANHLETPTSAMAILGDFCFFAGIPDKELAEYKPEWYVQDFIIAVPWDNLWAELIEECYGEKAKKVIRYGIKKEPDIFDEERLKSLAVSLPAEYTIRLIDEEIFNYCRSEPWCKDFVSQFSDFKMYEKYGLGVVILKDMTLVSGASSYSAYNGGIEIEIDTKKEYRRKGLATVCGAKLILECQKRNLYPSWDAQNKWSAALAEKLGYHFDREYTAYEIYE